MKFIVETPEGKFEVSVTKDVVSVGRLPENDIFLNYGRVSRKHCLISLSNGKIIVQDLGSANGTFIDGKKISSTEVSPGQKINVGGVADITVFLDGSLIENKELKKSEEEITKKDKLVEEHKDGKIKEKVKTDSAIVEMGKDSKINEVLPSQSDLIQRVKIEIDSLLRQEIDLRKFSIEEMSSETLREEIRNRCIRIIDKIEEKFGKLSTELKSRVIKEFLDEILGLGPLEDLIKDETVSEIMVNGKDQIYIEKGGKLILTDYRFSSDEAVMRVIERIVLPLGRRIDESMPMVDARLKDGSRVNAVIPPICLNGPTITIRKFSKKKLTPQDLLRFKSLSPGMIEFLRISVLARKNIIISGGTGSGKTTLLNILSSFIPEDERIITVEDAAELQLQQPHWVRLESRPPNIEGKGAITIRDLVRNCLRMRPERIIVGECRGGEALDMLQAMNTGHDGSMTTLHANSPRDALLRLETMVLMAGFDLPVRAIRSQISAVVDIIVQQMRLRDGSRKVIQIAEITGMEGDTIVMQEIFKFEERGIKDGKIYGVFKPTGVIPKFFQELKEAGWNIDYRIFEEEMEA